MDKLVLVTKVKTQVEIVSEEDVKENVQIKNKASISRKLKDL
jgi:arginine repressor